MNKYLRILLYASPAIVIAGSVGVYFALSTKEDAKSSTGNINHISSQSQHYIDPKIFPDLQANSYYKYIKLKDGRPYITDELIARVVNDVLKKMQFTDGRIKWGYKFIDSSTKEDLIISFKFTPSNENSLIRPSARNYHIKLTQT